MATCHWARHRLTNNNVSIKGMIEKLPHRCTQTSRGHSCQNKPSVVTDEGDEKRETLLSEEVQEQTKFKLVSVICPNGSSFDQS